MPLSDLALRSVARFGSSSGRLHRSLVGLHAGVAPRPGDEQGRPGGGGEARAGQLRTLEHLAPLHVVHLPAADDLDHAQCCLVAGPQFGGGGQAADRRD